MADDLRLFDPPEWMTAPRHPDLERQLSPDARRTQRQQSRLDQGIHPASGYSLLDPEWGYRCRDCHHAIRIDIGSRRVWKCRLHRLGLSHSAASDIRVSWPACTLFRLDTPVEVRRG